LRKKIYLIQVAEAEILFSVLCVKYEEVWVMKQLHLEDVGDLGSFTAELKYDGVRAYLMKKDGRVMVVNREGTVLTERLPETKDITLPDNTALDTEIVVFRNGKSHFGSVQRRVHTENKFRIGVYAKRLPVFFMVFDVLQMGGEDVRKKPIEERKKLLGKLESKHIKVVETHSDIKGLWEHVLGMELEGIVLKRKESPYSEDYWVKVKNKGVDSIYATHYEETPTGLVAISGKHRVTVNGKQAEKVKQAIPCKIRIEFLEVTEEGMFRQATFKGVE